MISKMFVSCFFLSVFAAGGVIDVILLDIVYDAVIACGACGDVTVVYEPILYRSVLMTIDDRTIPMIEIAGRYEQLL
jgi:hypothetical protein